MSELEKDYQGLKSNAKSMDVVVDGRYCYFGPYKGVAWNDLPIQYLKDLVKNEAKGTLPYLMAQKQLANRDVVSDDIKITLHVINRFSSRFFEEYLNNRLDGRHDPEGIVSYVSRKASEAWKSYGKRTSYSSDSIEVQYDNKRWVFANSKGLFLLSVIPNEQEG